MNKCKHRSTRNNTSVRAIELKCSFSFFLPDALPKLSLSLDWEICSAINVGGYFSRICRMFIRSSRPDEKSTPQQIGFSTVVPECISRSGILSRPDFKDFGTAIKKANQMLKQKEIKGWLYMRLANKQALYGLCIHVYRMRKAVGVCIFLSRQELNLRTCLIKSMAATVEGSMNSGMSPKPCFESINLSFSLVSPRTATHWHTHH